MQWLILVTVISVIAVIVFFLLSNKAETEKSFNILCMLTVISAIAMGVFGIATIIVGAI